MKRRNPRRKTGPGREAGLPDLGLLFEQAPDAIVVADARTGTIVDLNPAAVRMVGRSRRALRGQHYLTLHPRDQADAVRKAFERLARYGGGPCELELVRADGTLICVDVSASRIVHGDRRLVAGFFRDVSQRRVQQEAILASEQHFRQLADSITDVFFEMDRHLRYTYWNKASETMTGIAARDAIGKSLFEIFPDTPVLRKTVRVYREVLRTQRPKCFLHESAGPARKMLEITAYPSAHGLAVFVKDVTARLQMESTLRDSEVRFRTLVTNAPLVLFAIDRKGVFTLSEGKGLAKLGLAPGQVVGRSVFEVYRDYPQIMRPIRTALAGKAVLCEVPVKDLAYEVNLTPVRDERGRVVKVIGLANDITERKKAEAALAEEHNLYMDLVNSLPAGVYRLHIRSQKPWGQREWVGKVESNYHLELVSDRFCRFLGASRQQFEANAATVVDCLHPDDRESFVRKNVAALETMRPFEWEGRVRHAGATQWVRFLSVPRCLANGDVIWTGVLLDITESKRAEEALRKSREELEDRVRERTARLRALAAQLTGVEHKERRRIAEILHEDLQQRMAGMMYIIQGVVADKKGRLGDKEARLMLTQLTEAIQTMRDLTTRFRPPTLYEFGLPTALEWLAGQMHERFGLTVEIKGERNVQVDDYDMRLFAYQAVSELLMNVVKHAGVKRARVRIRREGRSGLPIEVSDRGLGFDVEKAHRAASFGLFSIGERVADFGGRFDVTSRPGLGTCATLWLPTARGSPASGAASASGGAAKPRERRPGA